MALAYVDGDYTELKSRVEGILGESFAASGTMFLNGDYDDWLDSVLHDVTSESFIHEETVEVAIQPGSETVNIFDASLGDQTAILKVLWVDYRDLDNVASALDWTSDTDIIRLKYTTRGDLMRQMGNQWEPNDGDDPEWWFWTDYGKTIGIYPNCPSSFSNGAVLGVRVINVPKTPTTGTDVVGKLPKPVTNALLWGIVWHARMKEGDRESAADALVIYERWKQKINKLAQEGMTPPFEEVRSVVVPEWMEWG